MTIEFDETRLKAEQDAREEQATRDEIRRACDGPFWCPGCGEHNIEKEDQPICEGCEEKEAQAEDRKQAAYDDWVNQRISEWKEEGRPIRGRRRP